LPDKLQSQRVARWAKAPSTLASPGHEAGAIGLRADPRTLSLGADTGLSSLFNLLELYANNCQPGNIEGVAEWFVVLMFHAAIGVVDAYRPNFFTGLPESLHDIAPIHAFRLVFKKLPELIPKRGNGIPAHFGFSFLSFCHNQKSSRPDGTMLRIYLGLPRSGTS
jgi:hypothetical protein